ITMLSEPDPPPPSSVAHPTNDNAAAAATMRAVSVFLCFIAYPPLGSLRRCGDSCARVDRHTAAFRERSHDGVGELQSPTPSCDSDGRSLAGTQRRKQCVN